jgi:pentapeptide repeat protein
VGDPIENPSMLRHRDPVRNGYQRSLGQSGGSDRQPCASKPELVAQFREGDPEKVKEALNRVERVKLIGRSLRGARFFKALLPGADLRAAELQGADLWAAQLQGADLQGAQLQGATLSLAQLQGADLQGAQLQGATLSLAQLQGADLRTAELYGAVVEKNGRALVDLRAARWTPLNQGQLLDMRKLLAQRSFAHTNLREDALERIERASNAGLPPPILESCLIDSEVTPVLTCQRQWLPVEVEAFRSELFPELEKLACQSSAIARGLIRQFVVDDTTSGRFGLAGRFVIRLDKRGCRGSAPCRRRARTRSATWRSARKDAAGDRKPAGQPKRCRHRRPHHLRSHPQRHRSRIIGDAPRFLLVWR